MKISLLISTYNWPEALARVLESVAVQTRLPDEVIVADDGSGEATRELIERVQKTFPCPLVHVWHEDKGFRKCIIWNKAIARAMGDLIVQIDGDCVLEKHFIADHAAFILPGTFTCGSRTLLTQERTARVLAGGKISAASSGVKNRFNALRLCFLRNYFRTRYRASVPFISKGCNMAFWREDLLRVNGYNEAISGWGREDAELEVRLMKAGVRRQSLKFGGVQFHLFHEENDRSRDAENLRILAAARASEEFFTPDGIVKNTAERSAQK